MRIPKLHNLVEGNWVSEAKTRFAATVRVGNAEVPCYVPFSSKLSAHLHLDGNRVLLKLRKTPAGEKLDLWAVKVARKWCLVDLREVNPLVGRYLAGPKGGRLVLDAEVAVYPGYRADFSSSDRKTVWEVKTLIPNQGSAIYPTMKLERAERQLLALVQLQAAGWAVNLVFVSLGTPFRSLRLDPRYTAMRAQLETLLSNGMTVTCLTVALCPLTLAVQVKSSRVKLPTSGHLGGLLWRLSSAKQGRVRALAEEFRGWIGPQLTCERRNTQKKGS